MLLVVVRQPFARGSHHTVHRLKIDISPAIAIVGHNLLPYQTFTFVLSIQTLSAIYIKCSYFCADWIFYFNNNNVYCPNGLCLLLELVID